MWRILRSEQGRVLKQQTLNFYGAGLKEKLFYYNIVFVLTLKIALLKLLKFFY